MKKIICILSVIIFTSPAFAQRNEMLRLGAEAIGTQSDIALKVGQTIGKNLTNAAPTTVTVQIVNWVEKPSIRVQYVENGPVPFISTEMAPVLTAEVLDWKTAAKYILPAGRDGDKAYVPTSFGQQKEPAFFRSIPLRRSSELKNLLVNGMELNKTASYFNGIFVADDATYALNYAVPWQALYPSMPVLVRIPNTPELVAENALERRTHFSGVFHKDVKPRFMSDIWVFLKINNNPGWYKVILVDDEMVFIPVLGTIKTR